MVGHSLFDTCQLMETKLILSTDVNCRLYLACFNQHSTKFHENYKFIYYIHFMVKSLMNMLRLFKYM